MLFVDCGHCHRVHRVPYTCMCSVGVNIVCTWEEPRFFPRDHDDQNRTRFFRTERKHFARCSTKYVFVEAWEPGMRLVTSVKCETRETRIVLYLYPNSVLQKTEYKVWWIALFLPQATRTCFKRWVRSERCRRDWHWSTLRLTTWELARKGTYY